MGKQMKKLAIQQNSEEWLEFRRGKSGGSEFKNLWPTGLPTKAAVVKKLEADGQPLSPADKKLTVARLVEMLAPAELAELKLESSPKMGYYEIIAGRVARPITPNDYVDRLEGQPFSMMARGHLLEKEALEAFSKKTGKLIHPGSCVWVHPYNDHIYISPDGEICNKDQVDMPVENFTPNEAVEVKCLNNAETVKAYLTGSYPKEYFPQILKYFIVNKELKRLYFVMYTDTIPGLELQIFPVNRSEVEDKLAEAEAFEIAMMAKAEEDIRKIEEIGF